MSASRPKFKVGDWVRILPTPPGVPRLKYHVAGDIGVIVRGPFRYPDMPAPADWPCYRLDITQGSDNAGLNEVCLALVPPPNTTELIELVAARLERMG